MVLSAILAVLCLAGSIVLIRKRRPGGKPGLVVAGVLFVVAAFLGPAEEEAGDLSATEVPVRLPKQVSENGYVSSESCRDCHEDEHATWHASFHRKMTQVVTPQTMAAPHEEAHAKMHGREFHFLPDGDRFLVETVDPEWDRKRQDVGLQTISENEDAPFVRRQIVMSTGSHHYQTYWINGTQGNQLWRLPWVYQIQMERWIPLQDTFIVPPIDHRNVADWNDNCVHCHSAGGEPGYDDLDVPDTRVGELGIACEACHGPGRKHVEHQRQLRESGQTESNPDQTIVNPIRLSHRRSAEVCGQCHSSSRFDGRQRTGFLPGQKLEDVLVVNRYEDEAVQKSRNLRGSFWGDGTMRVAGRDFSALEISACYQKGKITCTSCHSMHSYEDADDQLAPDMRTDAACLQCHDTLAADISSHTHHAAESSGSRCVNCHMPHTTFGLFKAIRSHRIDSPTTAMTLQHGRPNACVLCHVDRTLPWIDGKLAEWYGHEISATSEMAEQHSSAVIFLLSGDAVQRAVMAWNFGREETRQASGNDWQLPLLAELLDDRYSVVRAVAGKSIQQFPSAVDFKYDFIALPDRRSKSRSVLIQHWINLQSTTDQGARLSGMSPNELEPLLLKPSGERDVERLKKLLELRDDRDINLAE